MPARKRVVKPQRYEVTFSVPQRPLGNSDITFEIRDTRDRKVGTLKLSRGALEWNTFNSDLVYKRTWHAFDKLMTENVTPQRPHRRR